MKIRITHQQISFIEHLKHIFSYVFQILLFAFLVTLLLQQFYPLQVNSRININWFMVIVIIFGALAILLPVKKQPEEDKPITKRDIALIICLGIAGAVIIFLKLQSLGWMGYVISILGGLIIILLSWLVLTEKDEDIEEDEE